jgi:ABC-2 type transport system ATP-binding protein
MSEQGLAVEAAGLTKVFAVKGGSGVTALDALDLSLREGELTALVGPDGAGKTTLLRLICGLMTPTAGSLRVVGLDVIREPERVQRELGYMPQKFGLYEDLTVQENMNLYADLHGIPAAVRADRFRHLLQMTGLAEFTGRLAGNLSGGMKQKLGLACTLVRSPKLLLLDEPTVGVDPLSRRDLWTILEQLVQQEHLSVLVSTAYMDEAERCQQVYVMNHGRFLAAGKPASLREMAAGRCYETACPASMPVRVLQSRLLDEPAVVDAVPVHGAVHFIAGKTSPQLDSLAAEGLTPKPVPERLEDAFMLLLHADEAAQAGGKAAVAHLSAGTGKDRDTKMGSGKANPIGGASAIADAAQSTTELVDIEVSGLVRRFGDFTAVDHTSFQVYRGEVFGLLGPNGAGKTTTFRMLCGLLPATEGRLTVAGVDLREARREGRRNLGYVAQKFSLYGNLSVRENLRFYGGVYGLRGQELRARMATVMQEFQLTDRADVLADDLPGGYKQRLSMAAALIHDPQILFLDEPTSGIDPLARRRFWQQITDLSLRGTTIIITTHFMEEAEYCDRFMIQDHGQLLVLGSPQSIREQMAMPREDMNEIFLAIVGNYRAQEG